MYASASGRCFQKRYTHLCLITFINMVSLLLACFRAVGIQLMRQTEAGHVKAWKLSENGALTLEISPPQGIPIKRAYAFDMCFDDHCRLS